MVPVDAGAVHRYRELHDQLAADEVAKTSRWTELLLDPCCADVRLAAQVARDRCERQRARAMRARLQLPCRKA